MSVTDGAVEPREEAGVELRSAERLLLFTDAVAAIAITLLILPLVDLVPEAAREHVQAHDVISNHLDQIGGFFLSFLVIARLWLVHHKLFATVKTYNQGLVLWNLGWLLSIVVLPFSTEMVGQFGHERFTAVLYYTNVLAAMVCQTGMLLVLRRSPDMLQDAGREIRGHLGASLGNICALVVALAIALLVPGLQYYSMLTLLLVSPALRLLRSRGRATA